MSTDRGITYNTDPDNLIPPAEAAAMFGVTSAIIGRWARKGNIPYTRLPNQRMMYSRDWILEYLHRRGQNGQEE